jgi:hypothetical protein
MLKGKNTGNLNRNGVNWIHVSYDGASGGLF